MQYRFIKITSFYKNFLQSYEAANPDVLALSYDKQHQHLMSQGYGYSNYFPRYLKQNYGIDGHEIIHNATLNWLAHQRKGKPAEWNIAAEHQLKTDDKDSHSGK